MVNATPRPFYLRDRPGTQCIGGWLGPRDGLDRCGKSRPHRDSIRRPSSPQRVAIPTELLRSLFVFFVDPQAVLSDGYDERYKTSSVSFTANVHYLRSLPYETSTVSSEKISALVLVLELSVPCCSIFSIPQCHTVTAYLVFLLFTSLLYFLQ